MKSYSQAYSTTQTPQSQSIPNKTMTESESGGYVFPVDDWTRLDRFLILGTAEPTYYVGQQELTIQNADAVLRCIKADGLRVVSRTVEISVEGRAPKNDPAIFVLALAAKFGNESTRRAAYDAVSNVCRIPTHWFQFCEERKNLGGWGHGMRRAISSIYEEKDLDTLVYQMLKYRQRGGWTHRDVMRLAHPKTDGRRNEVLKWMVGHQKGTEFSNDYKFQDTEASLICDFMRLQESKDLNEAISIISTNKSISWEMIPTEYQNSPHIWEALLPNMPLHATVRNLARLTANGLLTSLSNATKYVLDKLGDAEYLHRSRMHPMSILIALSTYAQGHGVKGNLSWTPVPQILDALDSAFYNCFPNVNPINKPMLIAVDDSGSMHCDCMGVPGLTSARAAAALAMVFAKTEPQYALMVFSDHIHQIDISSCQRLDDVMQRVGDTPRGTDCALPFMYARGYAPTNSILYHGGTLEYAKSTNSVPAELFIVLTDSQSWAGSIHPLQALQKFRQETGINAKAVCGQFGSYGGSIADPEDAGMLDFVGLDSGLIQVIRNFAE